MSKLLKKNKLNINFHSSGAFLNSNKPKFLKFKQNHNVSQDAIQKETSKDEIIKLLKERITVLEKKVQLLEEKKNDNTNNTKKLNTLNLSHGDPKKKITLLPPGFKLNMKLIKNKNNFLNILNMSTTYAKKNNKNNNSIASLNNSNINYINTIEEKKNDNKSRNFFNSIYSNEYFSNNNIGLRISNSASKNKVKRFTILPKNKSKQKLFINVLRRTMSKCSTIDHGKFQNINDSNNNIPKIPRKGKQHKSEIIKNNSNKLITNLNNLNNSNIKNNSENKSKFLIFNNNSKEDSCILNTDNNLQNNNTSFNNIKDKLENIKKRTKSLLEFYSFNKNINNVNNNKNYVTLNNISTNINSTNNNIINEDNNFKESFNFNYNN
jgi:hypothetical protein